MISTPTLTTVTTVASVSSEDGKYQCSSLSGEAVTPGLTPPLLVLLGSTLHKGDVLWSVLFMLMAIYRRAFL
jgi:hypothetical protein